MAYKAGREELNELTVTKTTGTLLNSDASPGTTITPAANGGDAANLTMNVRSGKVSITCADVDLGAPGETNGGYGIGVTILSDKINLSDIVVAQLTLAGAGNGSNNFNNISVTPSIGPGAAYMFFWIGNGYGVYIMEHGQNDAHIFQLNWALI